MCINNNISNYLEAVPKEPNSVVSFYTANNDLLVTDTSFVYEAGFQYIYDPAGAIVDSVLVDQEASINIETLDEGAEGLPIARERVDNVAHQSVMSNSFGFGGTNCSLVLSAIDDKNF